MEEHKPFNRAKIIAEPAYKQKQTLPEMPSSSVTLVMSGSPMSYQAYANM